MFRWAHPEYLTYLLILIPMAIAFFLLIKAKIRKLKSFTGSKNFELLVNDLSINKLYFKYFLLIVIFGLLILSISNPQIGTKLEEVKQSGIDIMIVLDVSLSMKANDIAPNRLEYAKLQISELINRLYGDRIGLIVFSGEAYVQFPLTADYSAARLFLEAIDETTVPQHGTSLNAALELANTSFDNKPTQKAIIVISDGEDHEGNYISPVNEGKQKNIAYYSIGLGTKEGSKIPVATENNAIIYKKDFYDKEVITKLDDKVLLEIAKAGSGKYYSGSAGTEYLNSIYDELNNISKSEYGTKRITNYEDRYYYFLLIAFVLIIIEVTMNNKKNQYFKI